MLYNKPKRLGLYFHIPFCLSKCAYCDFFSFVPTNEELITRYINALITHMEEYENAAEDYTVDSVFIGGLRPHRGARAADTRDEEKLQHIEKRRIHDRIKSCDR